MSKRVLIAIDFDYDRDHKDDLLDVIQVSQIHSELSETDAHDQAAYLLAQPWWQESFVNAMANALTGAPTHFGSEEN